MKRVGTFEGRGTESPKVSFILYTTRSTSECRRGERERKKKREENIKRDRGMERRNKNSDKPQPQPQPNVKPSQVGARPNGNSSKDTPKTLQRKEVHNFQT
jgi:hypothetical protein